MKIFMSNFLQERNRQYPTPTPMEKPRDGISRQIPSQSAKMQEHRYFEVLRVVFLGIDATQQFEIPEKNTEENFME